jgi:hypothetical protein
MRAHYCSRCGQRVFFENVACTACRAALGYVPGEGMLSFEVDGQNWKRVGNAGAPQRPCANYVEHAVCNWMVAGDDPAALCRSCRLTRMIPALVAPGNVVRRGARADTQCDARAVSDPPGASATRVRPFLLGAAPERHAPSG